MNLAAEYSVPEQKATSGLKADRTRLTTTLDSLFEPTSGMLLALFRFSFGALLFWELVRYWPRISFYVSSSFHFPYEFATFALHPNESGMQVLFFVMGLSALCISAGLFFRVATISFFISFSYFFLIEQTRYLNHFYLIALMSLLLCFSSAHECFSIDRPTAKGMVPRWNYLIFRFQLALVYLYAGIAKLNADWLSGEPMTRWLQSSGSMSFAYRYIAARDLGLLFSYGGLVFDLFAGFLLLSKHTRGYVLPLVLAFHLMNAWIFHIGVFPWLMIAATMLFFDERKLQKFLVRIRLIKALKIVPQMTFSILRKRAVLIFLVLYVAVQLALPFRHLLYPGDVAWTEEGHKFSWRMKLRDKRGIARFLVIDATTGSAYYHDPRQVLSQRQYKKLSTRPNLVCLYAQHLSALFQEKMNGYAPRVYAHVMTSLNGRPFSWAVDPGFNFQGVACSTHAHDVWLTPDTNDLPKGIYPPKPTRAELCRRGVLHLEDSNIGCG